MNPRQDPGLGIDTAGNIVVPESVLINSTNEVLGTCRVTMDLEFRAGSPELKVLLAKVTADGLPYDSGWTEIEGDRLEELIAATTGERRECLRLSLDRLDDDKLALKCNSTDGAVKDLAVDLLGGRIEDGRPGAFPALLAAHAATTDGYCVRLLEYLIDRVVSPVPESINRKGIKELTRLAGDAAADPVVAHAAQERLALLGRRKADLQAIPGIPIADLVANLGSGQYAYDSGVKSAAIKRTRAETVGSGELAELLPIPFWDVDEFLNELGKRPLGHIDSWKTRVNRTRWSSDEVLPAIEFTTARLYHRALHEFDGRLPDELHNRMVFADGDGYAKAYVELLEEKKRVNEQGSEAT